TKLDVDVEEFKKALADSSGSWSLVPLVEAQTLPAPPDEVSLKINGCKCICPVGKDPCTAVAVENFKPPKQIPDQELFKKFLKDEALKAPKSIEQIPAN
ncbi:MAG: hypothetical protein WC824_06625, partial [Bacteroidota bacterium]